MWDFLTFKTFITPSILIMMYYFGVFAIGVFLWLVKPYIKNILEKINLKNSSYLFLTFGVVFFLFQLIWRMMFEMIIGYFNMHDYLQQIAQSLLHST